MSDTKAGLAPNERQLSDKQLEKLVTAHEAVEAANSSLREAVRRRADILELVFDSWDAPKESQVDLQRGVITFPDKGKGSPTATAPTEPNKSDSSPSKSVPQPAE